MSRRQVLLATSSDLPDGEPGGHVLPPAFAEHGIDARWVVWDDPTVDWSAGLVCVRSTWDYDRRRREFLDWAATVPRLLNGVDLFVWNTDKSYLVELAAAVPVVPTLVAEGEEDLPSMIAEFERAVVKPTVGAGGRGLVVFDQVPGDPAALDESALSPGPWVVQPLVESVRSQGEISVFVLGGQVVSQVRKRAAAGEIRVNEEYGGRNIAEPLSAEARELGVRTVAAAERIVHREVVYARVDAVRLADGTLAVSELEVTEPGLYLDVVPENAEAFAAAVADHLAAD